MIGNNQGFHQIQNLKPIPCILHRQYFSRHNFTISLRYLINYTRTHRWFLTKGCGLPIHPCKDLFLLLFIFIFLLYLSFARVILFFKLWLLIGIGLIAASEKEHVQEVWKFAADAFKGLTFGLKTLNFTPYSTRNVTVNNR